MNTAHYIWSGWRLTMLKLLVLIALQNSLSCCNEFAGPISHLRAPNDRLLKRQLPIGKKPVLADEYDDLQTYSSIKPQLQELYSASQFKNLNKHIDAINIYPLLPIDLMPEAQSQLLSANVKPGPKVDIPNMNPIIDDIDFIEILNDLSNCVELIRVQNLRSCPSIKENDLARHISPFQILTDEELEFEKEKRCTTAVNAILKKSKNKIKDSVKKNKDSSNDHGFKESTSLIRLSNDGLPSSKNTTIAKFISVSPHQNLQNGEIIIDYNKVVEDVMESYIKDTENTTTAQHDESEQMFWTDTTNELTNITDLDLASQITSDYYPSSEFDTTTINIHKIELQNALDDLFDPVQENNSKTDAPVSIHNASEDMSLNIYKEERSSLELHPSAAETAEDNPVSENLQVVNGRRSNLRPHVYENEVPVIKIITHEYPDGNVVSKVNGTEILINNDTASENNFTSVFVKNINMQDKNNVSEVLYKFSIPKHIPDNILFDPDSHTQLGREASITGRLYLIHNKEKIPAQFVQESDGNISVGLNILSICESEHYDSNSVLFKLLCKCRNC